jgi:DNA-binding transcriptional LysR family regulator
MQIELIETFLDLCDTRSFNRTAERLGVMQSTVSGRIRALESATGRRLFTRSRAGTQLTTEGLRFEPHARALRHAWVEALAATQADGSAAVTLRLGIQHDLTSHQIGAWVRGFRDALPGTRFYIEADYSPAMCSDLATGALDLGVMFTARMHPDLWFETLGEVPYRMISTETDRLAEVRTESYVLTNFSPAFGQTHADLLPALSAAGVATGQTGAAARLIVSLGGAGYVLEESGAALVGSGAARWVTDAPVIPQTVFAGVHMRHRHRPMHRRMLALLRGHFAEGGRKKGSEARKP